MLIPLFARPPPPRPRPPALPPPVPKALPAVEYGPSAAQWRTNQMVPDLLLILLVALYVVATLRDVFQSLQAQRLSQAGGTGKGGGLHRGSKVTPLDTGGGGGGGDGSTAAGRQSDSYLFTGGSTAVVIGSAPHFLSSGTVGRGHSGTAVRENLDTEDKQGRLLGPFPEDKQASVPTLLPQGKGAAKSGGPIAEATELLDYIRGKRRYGNDVSVGCTSLGGVGSTAAIGRDSGGSASGGVGSTAAIGRDALLLLATAKVARQRLGEGDASICQNTLDREAAAPGGQLEREELL